MKRSDSVVVITSASHAEGREFEPRSDLSFLRKMFENSSDFSYRIENDMWSVGVIAFTLLSGMAPFDG